MIPILLSHAPTAGLRRAGRRGSLRLLPLLCGFLASTACAQQTPDAAKPTDTRTFTLTPQFSVGQISHYKTHTVLTANLKTKGEVSYGQAASMDLTLRYKVLEIKPDGSVRLSVLSEGGITGSAGEDIKSARQLPRDPDNYNRILTLDRRSAVVAIQDGDATAQTTTGSVSGLFTGASMLIPFHFLALPDHPIKAGDSWTARYPLPNMSSSAHAAKRDNQTILANMKLLDTEMVEKHVDGFLLIDPANPKPLAEKQDALKTEKVEKQETLKIEQVFTIPYESDVDDQLQATADAKNAAGHVSGHFTFALTVHVLPTNGQVVLSQGTVSGAMKFTGSIIKKMPGDTLTFSGIMAVNYVPENANPTPSQNLTDKK